MVPKTEMPFRFLKNLCTPEVLPVQLSEKTTILRVAVLHCIMGIMLGHTCFSQATNSIYNQHATLSWIRPIISPAKGVRLYTYIPTYTHKYIIYLYSSLQVFNVQREAFKIIEALAVSLAIWCNIFLRIFTLTHLNISKIFVLCCEEHVHFHHTTSIGHY
jgi:hypothetical protein